MPGDVRRGRERIDIRRSMLTLVLCIRGPEAFWCGREAGWRASAKIDQDSQTRGSLVGPRDTRLRLNALGWSSPPLFSVALHELSGSPSPSLRRRLGHLRIL